jgi:DNA (cytosine-5)-methyltransferase 1
VKPHLLDLFSGAGGSARGYQLAGFHVTGVDLKRQPRYAGDEFVQADALTFPLDGFVAIHASPPCQRWANVTAWRGDQAAHPDLLDPIRARLLSEANVPWVIENVPEAPLRRDYLLCGSMFGLRVKRHRVFETSWGGPAELQAPCGSHYRLLPFMHKGERAYADAMGCTWMTKEEAREAIPPKFAEHIGRLVLQIPGVWAAAHRSPTAGQSVQAGHVPDGTGPAHAPGPPHLCKELP